MWVKTTFQVALLAVGMTWESLTFKVLWPTKAKGFHDCGTSTFHLCAEFSAGKESWTSSFLVTPVLSDKILFQ